MGKIIGIDLGTTNSCMAVMEGGEPTIIPNAEGGRVTPSVVYFSEDGDIVVGEMAKRQAILHPDRTVRSIKRLMGTKKVKKIGDKKYRPEQISAMILEKLKSDAEAYLGEEVKEAVITVPAYFEDPQRQATKDAGRIAGLEVKRIINEPTASCLAYGLDKEEELTVMVCDFGGGTFDVSILEIGEGVFEVKATSGNNKLGGDDFDNALMEYLISSFKKDTGVDLHEDKSALQRLKEAAEKAKIELSNMTSTTISLPFIAQADGEAKHLEMTITRAKFEELIHDIVEKTIEPIKTAMKDAKVKASDLDKVLLVGGSTRVPLVQKRFKDILNKEPSKSINPDEAVALGAAIQGGILAGEVKDVLLLDVTPLTLGIETAGGLFAPVIPRNTTIPCKKTQIFTTSMDNQSTVEVHVLQGERPLAKDNRSLGKFHLIGIPPAPRGVPQIEVSFDIDANGIVHVSAKDLGTEKEQRMTITGTSTLDEKDIQAMIQEAEEHRKQDLKKKKRIELMNEAENLIYNTKHGLEDAREKLDPEKVKEAKHIMKKLEKAIEDKDYRKIKEYKDDLAIVANELFTEMYSRIAAEREILAPSEEAVAGGPSDEREIESYKPEKLKCPKCGTVVTVETPIRPIDVTCPNCGFTATLHERKAKKKEEEEIPPPPPPPPSEEGIAEVAQEAQPPPPPPPPEEAEATSGTEEKGKKKGKKKVKKKPETKEKEAKRGAKKEEKRKKTEEEKKKGPGVQKESGAGPNKGKKAKEKGKKNLKIKCPKCATVIVVEAKPGEESIEAVCPNCGYTGTIKRKKK